MPVKKQVQAFSESDFIMQNSLGDEPSSVLPLQQVDAANHRHVFGSCICPVPYYSHKTYFLESSNIIQDKQLDWQGKNTI